MSTASRFAFGNLFADLAREADAERFDALVARRGVTIERIVSTGQASPPDFWYDDPRAEWVALLTGSAALEFAGEAPRTLRPGDYVHIPAHCRHRVAWTDAEVPTVWLTVYFAGHDGARDTADDASGNGAAVC